MNNENNQVRDGIIATVVGGIILGILAWIFEGVRILIKTIFDWLISSLISIKDFAVNVWDYLQSPVTINWGFFWLLGILSLIALWKILQPTIYRLVEKNKTPQQYKPRLDDYRKDRFFQIIWEWSSIYGTMPSKPEGFCGVCSTRLVYRLENYPDKTSFVCQSCDRTIKTLDGDLDFALSTVRRETERRIKTGEWEAIVIRQHNEKTG